MHSKSTSQSTENLLSKLFQVLFTSGVEYCVMRNYEKLPHSFGNHDIDIMILSIDDRICFEKIIIDVIKQSKWDLVINCRHHGYEIPFFEPEAYHLYQLKGDDIEHIQIDLFSGVYNLMSPLLSSNEYLCSRRIRNSNIYIPNRKIESFHKFFQLISNYSNNDTSVKIEAYRSFLIETYSNDQETAGYMDNKLYPFGQKIFKHLNNNNTPLFLLFGRFVKFKFFIIGLITRPIVTLSIFIERISWLIKKKTNPCCGVQIRTSAQQAIRLEPTLRTIFPYILVDENGLAKKSECRRVIGDAGIVIQVVEDTIDSPVNIQDILFQFAENHRIVYKNDIYPF